MRGPHLPPKTPASTATDRMEESMPEVPALHQRETQPWCGWERGDVRRWFLGIKAPRRAALCHLTQMQEAAGL